MRSYISRFVILFLVLTLCLPLLTACGDNGAGGVDTTTEAVTGEPLSDENLYVIVRSDNASKEQKDAAIALRVALYEQFGIDIVLYTDWYNSADPNQKERYPHEIMIGSTNREESETVKQMIADSEDMYHYVIRGTGNDYVIAAEDGYYQSAVDAFLAMFEADQTMLYRAADIFDEIKERTFSLEELTIYGKDITEYTAIVYPADYSAFERGDATNLATLIFETSGYRIPVVADDQEYTAPVIRIGGSQNADVLAAGGFSYSVEETDEGITLAGTEFYSNWVAIDVLETAIREGRTSGKVHFTTETERISPIKTDGFHMMAWLIFAKSITDEKNIAEIKECGFDVVIQDISGQTTDARIAEFCKWYTKYELQVLWMDTDHYVNEYFSEDQKPYRDYVWAPATWGHMIVDEPNASEYDLVNKLYQSYSEKVPDKVGFVNLFPDYATLGQLKADSYREYVELCIDTIHPEVLSVDIYPLQRGEIYPGYLNNLAVFSSVCKEKNTPWMLYIQSNRFDHMMRAPEEEDLRWQIWCGLSFGTSSIQYFTYLTSEAEEHSPALIDRDKNKTALWYAAQKVNAEINAFTDVYMTYESLGAYTVGATAKYAKFEDQYTGFTAIGDVAFSGDDGVLIGAFEKKDGEGKAFTCVNMADPGAYAKSATITVEINEGDTVTIYQKGEAKLLPVVDGTITFTLDVGEGVFITLDPA